MAFDATLVAPLHANVTPWPEADGTDGVAILRGEKTKTDRYPELVDSTIVRLVTLACEVGGRWSPTTQEVLGGLAAARARTATSPLRSAARAAWQWLELPNQHRHAGGTGGNARRRRARRARRDRRCAAP